MVEPDPGPFPVSMWYPQNYAANNSNVTQKSDLTQEYFGTLTDQRSIKSRKHEKIIYIS